MNQVHVYVFLISFKMQVGSSSCYFCINKSFCKGNTVCTAAAYIDIEVINKMKSVEAKHVS
jgi:hypothetical protein